MSIKDIKIPADASDGQTTDAKTAIPPAEFSVARDVDATILSITDRQAVSSRVPTVSYRVYFLPSEFMPDKNGTAGVRRLAGKNVAYLVTDVSAPGRGTTLVAKDTTYQGQSGHYYCVAVNRSGVEAPPEHIVSTDDLASPITTGATVTPPGPPPIFTAVVTINADPTANQFLTAGAGIAITDTGAGGHTIAATGGGGFTMENSTTVVDGIATVFTFSTAVSANDAIFADGRLMDEAIGDYTRLGVTVTFAFAPISTAKRIF